MCSDIGGFVGLFSLDLKNIRNPILVSGTDGVGTKLKIAFAMDRHDTVGIDAVAMCVNDVLAQGAEPLFFLDYVAIGHNIPAKVEAIVSGVAEGCRQAGCALVGGETAEMPGMYTDGEYDIAGYTTGVVEKSKLIDGTKVKVGDVLVGIASSGVHSNGFSLVRSVFDVNEEKLNMHFDDLGATLGETLLTPTRIYVKAVMSLLDAVNVKSVSHITGGGFYENIPRSIPDGLGAKIDKASVRILPIFKLIAEKGNITERDMFNTYNMGVGMSIVVPAEQKDLALEILKANGEDAYVIGEIIASEEKIVIE